MFPKYLRANHLRLSTETLVSSRLSGRCLKWLDLDGCTGVTDLGPLRGLTGLESLDLDGCTGVTDLGPLRGLTALHIIVFMSIDKTV